MKYNIITKVCYIFELKQRKGNVCKRIYDLFSTYNSSYHKILQNNIWLFCDIYRTYLISNFKCKENMEMRFFLYVSSKEPRVVIVYRFDLTKKNKINFQGIFYMRKKIK